MFAGVAGVATRRRQLDPAKFWIGILLAALPCVAGEMWKRGEPDDRLTLFVDLAESVLPVGGRWRRPSPGFAPVGFDQFQRHSLSGETW